jgi:hypothetical protein
MAFVKIRRNPDTDGQKTNPCLTSDFKNVRRIWSHVTIFVLSFLKSEEFGFGCPEVAWISRIFTTALIFLFLFLSRKKERKEFAQHTK